MNKNSIRILRFDDRPLFISSSFIAFLDRLILNQSPESNISKSTINSEDQLVYRLEILKEYAGKLLFHDDSFCYFLAGKVLNYLINRDSIDKNPNRYFEDGTNIFDLTLFIEDGALISSFRIHSDFKLDDNASIEVLVEILYALGCKLFHILFSVGEKQLSLIGLDNNDSSFQFTISSIHDLVANSNNKLAKALFDSFWNEEKGVDNIIKYRIRELLKRDICFSLEEVATKLQYSTRSLQRRLKDKRTSFSDVKEELRKELVLEYLKDASLSITDISDLLGYSERSAFERAFKKWYDDNPSKFRS